MAKHFFLKHGVRNRIQFKNGQSIPFTPVSESRGIIVIEDEIDGATSDAMGYLWEAKQQIADLDLYIKKRIGGVERIDEARYEELKKNPAPSREEKLKAQAPKLFVQSADPFNQSKASAAPATAPVAASPAEEPSSAVSARGAAGLGSIPPARSGGRPAVRTTKGKASQAAQTAPETAPVAVTETPSAAPAATDSTPPAQAASEPSATPAKTE